LSGIHHRHGEPPHCQSGDRHPLQTARRFENDQTRRKAFDKLNQDRDDSCWLAKDILSPVRRTATSRMSLDVSIPTKKSCWFIVFLHYPSLRKCGILSGPQQLSGLRRQHRGDPGLGTGFQPKALTVCHEGQHRL
jgi:hypothetical protein